MLPIVLQKCYTIGVTHYQRIEQEAIGSNGAFTYRTAKDIGIRSVELLRWIKAGKVIKAGYGVYRLAAYPVEGELMDRALLLAEVGEDSCLWGETALGFLGLCPTRSYVAYVGTPRRIRRHLSPGVFIRKLPVGYKPFYPKGVACQKVEDAIRAAAETIEGDRLREAIGAAIEGGYLMESEGDALKKEVCDGQAAT